MTLNEETRSGLLYPSSSKHRCWRRITVVAWLVISQGTDCTRPWPNTGGGRACMLTASPTARTAQSGPLSVEEG